MEKNGIWPKIKWNLGKKKSTMDFIGPSSCHTNRKDKCDNTRGRNINPPYVFLNLKIPPPKKKYPGKKIQGKDKKDRIVYSILTEQQMNS